MQLKHMVRYTKANVRVVWEMLHVSVFIPPKISVKKKGEESRDPSLTISFWLFTSYDRLEDDAEPELQRPRSSVCEYTGTEPDEVGPISRSGSVQEAGRAV